MADQNARAAHALGGQVEDADTPGVPNGEAQRAVSPAGIKVVAAWDRVEARLQGKGDPFLRRRNHVPAQRVLRVSLDCPTIGGTDDRLDRPEDLVRHPFPLVEIKDPPRALAALVRRLRLDLALVADAE